MVLSFLCKIALLPISYVGDAGGGDASLSRALPLSLWGEGPRGFLRTHLVNVPALAEGSPDALQNPCYIGTHGCDTNAACRPGPGNQFTCECSIGFRGDGRTCHGTASVQADGGGGETPGGVRFLPSRVRGRG